MQERQCVVPQQVHEREWGVRLLEPPSKELAGARRGRRQARVPLAERQVQASTRLAPCLPGTRQQLRQAFHACDCC